MAHMNKAKSLQYICVDGRTDIYVMVVVHASFVVKMAHS